MNLTATVTLGGDPLPVDSGKVTFTVKDGSTVIGSPVDDTTVEDGAAGVTYTLPAGTDVDDYPIHAAYDGTTLDNSAGQRHVDGRGGASWLSTPSRTAKEYGEADPTFGWNLSGFKNSKTATSAGVTGEADCSRETGQAVDSYTITCDPGTLDADNYSFATGDTAEFDITEAQLAVNAEPDSKEYGEADPTFGWNLSGFENSETATSAGVTGEADCSRETGQAVDSYAHQPATRAPWTPTTTPSPPVTPQSSTSPRPSSPSTPSPTARSTARPTPPSAGTSAGSRTPRPPPAPV